jgi:hypothetical protein
MSNQAQNAIGQEYSPNLSSEQVAEHFGVGPRTPAYWRETGTGPRWFRVGKHIRYRMADVLAWEEELLAAQEA